jgi:transposase InsO family protein
MQHNFSHIRLAKLCGWFGITRQAYYQSQWRGAEQSLEQDFILTEVLRIRSEHRRMGTRKLYALLQPFMTEHKIKMGRDGLFNLLAAKHLLVRRVKTRITTTQSFHWLRKYPNLIRSYTPTAINQLWVSDITHWKTHSGSLYISFITDAYSHKIVGYNVAETLEAVQSIMALEMALTCPLVGQSSHLIHHSDRGVQYCSAAYVKLLRKNNIKISMTENGDPLENALAERINGIMKEEYLNAYTVNTLQEAKDLLKHAVDLYNNQRPHMSISNLTPNLVHQSNNSIKTEKLWKNYYRKPSTFVNLLQDELPIVNALQDYSIKL